MTDPSIVRRIRMRLAEWAFLLAGWLDETYAVWIDDAPRRKP